MSHNDLERYKQVLLALRGRLTGEVERIVNRLPASYKRHEATVCT
jgi:hypothetical protein